MNLKINCPIEKHGEKEYEPSELWPSVHVHMGTHLCGCASGDRTLGGGQVPISVYRLTTDPGL